MTGGGGCVCARIGLCSPQINSESRLMSIKQRLFISLSYLILSLSLSTAARAYDCIASAPVREDNSWQNWYVENKCLEPIELHYTHKDRSGIRNASAVALGCKRTLLIQTFKSDEINWAGHYDQPQSPSMCDKPPTRGLKLGRPPGRAISRGNWNLRPKMPKVLLRRTRGIWPVSTNSTSNHSMQQWQNASRRFATGVAARGSGAMENAQIRTAGLPST
jgi:hypothetical protein